MRYRHLLFLSSTLATAIVFACSYGSYDGSYTGDAGDGGAGAGTVVLTQTVDPNGASLRTPDGAFEVTFAGGTFDAPVKVTITRLADRRLNDNFIVPTYGVAADKEPGLPFEVKFTGGNTNPNPSQVLAVVQAGADKTFKPVQLVGRSNTGGGPGTFWGLTRTLGTFSLFFEPLLSSSGYFDLAPDSCIAKCCTGGLNGGGGNAGTVGSSCLCNGEANLSCFLSSCVPNVAQAIERCVEIGNTGAQNVACKSSGPIAPCTGGSPQCGYPTMPCNSPSTCCINAQAGQCLGQGGPGPLTCNGVAVRCDRSTPCPAGTKCCVFASDAYCASACPNERTWCDKQGDCDGGASADGGSEAPPSDAGDAPCRAAPGCPHGTCGTPPAACN